MPSVRKKLPKPDIPDVHEEGVEELREAFDLFDTKGVGEIPMCELVESMQNLGFQDKNPMMFEMVVKLSTKRKGGNITFVQFAEDLASFIRDVDQENDLRVVFNMLDRGNTGRITLENLKSVAKEFGETTSDAELLEMMDTAKHSDPEGLGVAGDEHHFLSNEVSFREFYNLMMKGKPVDASSSNHPEEAMERSTSVLADEGDDGTGCPQEFVDV